MAIVDKLLHLRARSRRGNQVTGGYGCGSLAGGPSPSQTQVRRDGRTNNGKNRSRSPAGMTAKKEQKQIPCGDGQPKKQKQIPCGDDNQKEQKQIPCGDDN